MSNSDEQATDGNGKIPLQITIYTYILNKRCVLVQFPVVNPGDNDVMSNGDISEDHEDMLEGGISGDDENMSDVDILSRSDSGDGNMISDEDNANESIEGDVDDDGFLQEDNANVLIQEDNSNVGSNDGGYNGNSKIVKIIQLFLFLLFKPL